MARRCASVAGINAEREQILSAFVHFVGVRIFIITKSCAIDDAVVVVVVLRTWRYRERQRLFRRICRVRTG